MSQHITKSKKSKSASKPTEAKSQKQVQLDLASYSHPLPEPVEEDAATVEVSASATWWVPTVSQQDTSMIQKAHKLRCNLYQHMVRRVQDVWRNQRTQPDLFKE